MNKHVQIRNLDNSKHRALKGRAAERGMSISDYVKQLIDYDLEKPTWAEIARRVSAMAPIELPETSAEMIRKERDSL